MRYARTAKAIGLALAGILLAANGAQATQAASATSDPTPCPNRLVSAHEGNTAHTDGDTVASAVDAFAIGATMADSDLWVTKDGYIVQMHDNDVSHSTNGTGLVTEMTFDQVEALRTRYYNQPIPTLDDSLAIPRAGQAGRFLMFETKFSFSSHRNLQLLADQIAAAGMTDHVIIYSAYLGQLRYLKQIDPGLTVWFKAGGVPSVEKVAGLNGVMIPATLISAKNVAKYHAAGLTVMRERVTDSIVTWNKFVATGAESLMTDQPALVIRLCRELG